MDLNEVTRQVGMHLERIAELFKPEIKLTLIARLPGNDEADFLLTSDDLGEALKLIKRRLKATASDAEQAYDGDWLQPTVNPFGHACCHCSLFHQVEYRVIDDIGEEVEGNIQLKFTLDETETARLRAHQEER